MLNEYLLYTVIGPAVFNDITISSGSCNRVKAPLVFLKAVIIINHIYVTLMILMRCSLLILKQLVLVERIVFQPRVDFSNFISFLANVTLRSIYLSILFLRSKHFLMRSFLLHWEEWLRIILGWSLVLGQISGCVLLLQDFFFFFLSLNFFLLLPALPYCRWKIRMFAWAWYQVPNLSAFPFYFQA